MAANNNLTYRLTVKIASEIKKIDQTVAALEKLIKTSKSTLSDPTEDFRGGIEKAQLEIAALLKSFERAKVSIHNNALPDPTREFNSGIRYSAQSVLPSLVQSLEKVNQALSKGFSDPTKKFDEGIRDTINNDINQLKNEIIRFKYQFSDPTKDFDNAIQNTIKNEIGALKRAIKDLKTQIPPIKITIDNSSLQAAGAKIKEIFKPKTQKVLFNFDDFYAQEKKLPKKHNIDVVFDFAEFFSKLGKLSVKHAVAVNFDFTEFAAKKNNLLTKHNIKVDFDLSALAAQIAIINNNPPALKLNLDSANINKSIQNLLNKSQTLSQGLERANGAVFNLQDSLAKFTTLTFINQTNNLISKIKELKNNLNSIPKKVNINVGFTGQQEIKNISNQINNIINKAPDLKLKLENNSKKTIRNELDNLLKPRTVDVSFKMTNLQDLLNNLSKKDLFINPVVGKIDLIDLKDFVINKVITPEIKISNFDLNSALTSDQKTITPIIKNPINENAATGNVNINPTIRKDQTSISDFAVILASFITAVEGLKTNNIVIHPIVNQDPRQKNIFENQIKNFIAGINENNIPLKLTLKNDTQKTLENEINKAIQSLQINKAVTITPELNLSKLSADQKTIHPILKIKADFSLQNLINENQRTIKLLFKWGDLPALPAVSDRKINITPTLNADSETLNANLQKLIKSIEDLGNNKIKVSVIIAEAQTAENLQKQLDTIKAFVYIKPLLTQDSETKNSIEKALKNFTQSLQIPDIPIKIGAATATNNTITPIFNLSGFTLSSITAQQRTIELLFEINDLKNKLNEYFTNPFKILFDVFDLTKKLSNIEDSKKTITPVFKLDPNFSLQDLIKEKQIVITPKLGSIPTLAEQKINITPALNTSPELLNAKLKALIKEVEDKKENTIQVVAILFQGLNDKKNLQNQLDEFKGSIQAEVVLNQGAEAKAIIEKDLKNFIQSLKIPAINLTPNFNNQQSEKNKPNTNTIAPLFDLSGFNLAKIAENQRTVKVIFDIEDLNGKINAYFAKEFAILFDISDLNKKINNLDKVAPVFDLSNFSTQWEKLATKKTIKVDFVFDASTQTTLNTETQNLQSIAASFSAVAKELTTAVSSIKQLPNIVPKGFVSSVNEAKNALTALNEIIVLFNENEIKSFPDPAKKFKAGIEENATKALLDFVKIYMDIRSKIELEYQIPDPTQTFKNSLLASKNEMTEFFKVYLRIKQEIEKQALVLNYNSFLAASEAIKKQINEIKEKYIETKNYIKNNNLEFPTIDVINIAEFKKYFSDFKIFFDTTVKAINQAKITLQIKNIKEFNELIKNLATEIIITPALDNSDTVKNKLIKDIEIFIKNLESAGIKNILITPALDSSETHKTTIQNNLSALSGGIKANILLIPHYGLEKDTQTNIQNQLDAFAQSIKSKAFISPAFNGDNDQKTKIQNKINKFINSLEIEKITIAAEFGKINNQEQLKNALNNFINNDLSKLKKEIEGFTAQFKFDPTVDLAVHIDTLINQKINTDLKGAIDNFSATLKAPELSGFNEKIAEAIEKLNKDIKLAITELSSTTKDLTSHYNTIGKKTNDYFSNVKTKVEETTAVTETLRTETDKTNKSLQKQNTILNNLLGLGAGVGAGASVFFPITAAVRFEDKLAEVKKVMDDLDDPEILKDFQEQIKSLGREIPVTLTGLLDIAKTGAMLGVPYEKIQAFTKSVASISTAFEMNPDETATYLAKAANQYKVALDELSEISDPINTIANNMPVMERELLNALSRTAGGINAAKGTIKEATALVGTLIALGREPEVASTGVNALLTKLAAASEDAKLQDALAGLGVQVSTMEEEFKKGGLQAKLDYFFGQIRKQLPTYENLIKQLDIDMSQLKKALDGDDISAVSLSKKIQSALEKQELNIEFEKIGINTEELKRKLQEGFSGDGINVGLQYFNQKIQEFARSGSTELMNKMTEFFGLEYADDMLIFLNGLDVYEKAKDLMAGSLSSAEEEAQRRAQTTAKQMQIAMTSLEAMAQTAGSIFLPDITKFAQQAAKYFEENEDKVRDFVASLKDLATNFAVIGRVAFDVIGSLANLFINLQGNMDLLTAGIAGIAGGLLFGGKIKEQLDKTTLAFKQTYSDLEKSARESFENQNQLHAKNLREQYIQEKTFADRSQQLFAERNRRVLEIWDEERKKAPTGSVSDIDKATAARLSTDAELARIVEEGKKVDSNIKQDLAQSSVQKIRADYYKTIEKIDENNKKLIDSNQSLANETEKNNKKINESNNNAANNTEKNNQKTINSHESASSELAKTVNDRDKAYDAYSKSIQASRDLEIAKTWQQVEAEQKAANTFGRVTKAEIAQEVQKRLAFEASNEEILQASKNTDAMRVAAEKSTATNKKFAGSLQQQAIRAEAVNKAMATLAVSFRGLMSSIGTSLLVGGAITGIIMAFQKLSESISKSSKELDSISRKFDDMRKNEYSAKREELENDIKKYKELLVGLENKEQKIDSKIKNQQSNLEQKLNDKISKLDMAQITLANMIEGTVTMNDAFSLLSGENVQLEKYTNQRVTLDIVEKSIQNLVGSLPKDPGTGVVDENARGVRDTLIVLEELNKMRVLLLEAEEIKNQIALAKQNINFGEQQLPVIAKQETQIIIKQLEEIKKVASQDPAEFLLASTEEDIYKYNERLRYAIEILSKGRITLEDVRIKIEQANIELDNTNKKLANALDTETRNNYEKLHKDLSVYIDALNIYEMQLKQNLDVIKQNNEKEIEIQKIKNEQINLKRELQQKEILLQQAQDLIDESKADSDKQQKENLINTKKNLEEEIKKLNQTKNELEQELKKLAEDKNINLNKPEISNKTIIQNDSENDSQNISQQEPDPLFTLEQQRKIKEAAQQNIQEIGKLYQKISSGRNALISLDELIEKMRSQGQNIDVQPKLKERATLLLQVEQWEEDLRLLESQQRVQIGILQLQGNTLEARSRELQLQHAHLIQNLKDLNNKKGQEGLLEVENLINMSLQQVQFEQFSQQFERLLTEIQEKTKEADLSFFGRGKNDLSVMSDEAEKLILKMHELAQSLGNDELMIRLKAMVKQLQEIGEQTTALDVLMNTFKTSLESGLSNALFDLATGAKTVKEAFMDMTRSILEAIIRISSQKIAEHLISFIPFLAGGAGAAAGGTVIPSALNMGATAAPLQHTGGIAGKTTQTKTVSIGAFLGAPSLHKGGVLGLTAGEIPTILKVGEEVLTADDPRHINNILNVNNMMKAPQPAVQNNPLIQNSITNVKTSADTISNLETASKLPDIRIVNTTEQSAEDFANSAQNEKIIINNIQKNRDKIRKMLK